MLISDFNITNIHNKVKHNFLRPKNFSARFFDEAVEEHHGDDGVGFGGGQAGFSY